MCINSLLHQITFFSLELEVIFLCLPYQGHAEALCSSNGLGTLGVIGKSTL